MQSHPHSPIRLKADLLLLLVSLIWGTAFVAQSIAGKYGLAFMYNGASFLLASLALLPLIPRVSIPSSQWKWMLVGGVLLFAGSALQQVGMLYTKAANASFLTSLYVVFTPFLLWIGYRERPRNLHLAAMTIALAGAFLLSTGGEYKSQAGDILETLGALFWGLHFVLLAKRATRFHSISFAAGQFFICGLLNSACGLFREEPSKLLALPVMAATLYRALLSIGVGYTVQVWAQKHTSPTETSLIVALESVFAAIVAWLLLHEQLTFPQLAGCTLILLSAAASQLKGTVPTPAISVDQK